MSWWPSVVLAISVIPLAATLLGLARAVALRSRLEECPVPVDRQRLAEIRAESRLLGQEMLVGRWNGRLLNRDGRTRRVSARADTGASELPTDQGVSPTDRGDLCS